MKKLSFLISLLSFSIILFSGCDSTQSAAANNRASSKPQPTVTPLVNVNSTNNLNNNYEEGNEITNCSPEKIYRGEILSISFRKPHGGKMLIYREPRENFYFINTNETGSSPILTEELLENSSNLELDTENTRKKNYRKTNSSGEYTIIDRVFNKTGWYWIIIGHEPLDVDFLDMPVTGSCRFYYVNKKRPQGK